MDPRDILASRYVTDYTGPILFVDPEVVYQNVKRFQAAMPRVEVNYAVKSNSCPQILKAVAAAGGSFDVASAQEAQLVLNQTTAGPSKVLYSNPVRPDRYLQQCSSYGINWYVVDSMHELIKVVKNTAKPQIYIRLDVPNDLAEYSLAGKFGMSLKESESIVDYCAEHGIALRGVSFHAGSQITNPIGWSVGIQLAKKLFHYMEYKGLHPDFLNIGGGFPVKYANTSKLDINVIGEAINNEIADLPDRFRIVAEPGRFISAQSCNLLAQVISTTIRNNQLWAYLDIGVFHGLIESSQSESFQYHTETVSQKPRVKFTIAGPTCDSMDIVSKSTYLPHNLKDGDFVVFQNAGAYSITYATNFNGFPAPKLVVI